MRREYVFAFEGQGSVFPDVMKEEYFGVPKFRELFDEISELMKEDIKDICWGRRKYKLKTNPYKVSLKKEERNSIFITFSRFMGEYLTPKDIGNVLCYFLGRIKEYITFDEIVVVDSLGVISSIKSKQRFPFFFGLGIWGDVSFFRNLVKGNPYFENVVTLIDLAESYTFERLKNINKVEEKISNYLNIIESLNLPNFASVVKEVLG